MITFERILCATDLSEASVPSLKYAFALAKEIAGAQLLALERVGHEVPHRAICDVVVHAILRHTASAP